MTTHDNDDRLHLCFVCTGNICRSPMAEVIVHAALDAASLSNVAHTSSCGIGGWHVGDGADRRTVTELAQHGYDGSQHRAAKFGSDHADADVFIAMDAGHVRELQRLGVEGERIRLLRSFDPAAPADAEVADPYYGDQSDFGVCREQIEAATPGIIVWVKDSASSH